MNRWELEELHPDLDVRTEINEGRLEEYLRSQVVKAERRDDWWNNEYPPPPF